MQIHFSCLKECLSTVADVATIFGVVYGLFWLNAYKKQKKIDNAIADARRALDELRCVKYELKILDSGNDNERYKVIADLPISLRELYHTIFLLQDCHGIPESLAMIEKLLRINWHCYPNEIRDEVNQIIFFDSSGQGRLEDLENILFSIYKINIQTPRTKS